MIFEDEALPEASLWENPNSLQAIILFDGICNLCSRSVQFVIKYDKHHYFKFASLQSKYAKSLLLQMDLSQGFPADSVMLIEGKKTYFKSEAAIRIAAKLSRPVKYLAWVKFIPLWLRDPIYDFIAKNRYAWFGKKDSCIIPAPDIISRFL